MTCSLQKFYLCVGTCKQSFHGYLSRVMEQKSKQHQVIDLVHKIRGRHPVMGLRDLYFMIQPEGLGRDAFEALGKQAGLGVKKFKNLAKTTDSRTTVFYPNLIEKVLVERPNQVWQSDITYFSIKNKFYFITLIQDAFTKMIVGHNASAGLKTEQTTLPALTMAIKNRKKMGIDDLIFHSDGGGQYYDKEFIKLTGKYKIKNSMGKSCYENAMAESLNGVIKNKYLRHRKIDNLEDLKQELDRTVQRYNSEKPHSALRRMNPQNFEKKYLTSIHQTESTSTELVKQSSEMSNVRGIDPLTFEPNRISDSRAIAKVSKV